MISDLKENRYILHSKKNIWQRPDYQSIAYSDGDETENRVCEIIRTASDLGIFSKELKQGIVDWPTLYHLSSTRANVLRPCEKLLENKIVLEIGCGCGAITRFLGETAQQVLSLEGAIRRAAIARLRTRDLENVEVVADNFESFNIDRKFDVVTLIGVLEYANVFINSGDAINKMLQKASAFLKPGGHLIVAIENQLGLKYFSGAPEDHCGKSFYGIEDRYRKEEVITFGRYGLENTLKTGGFKYVEFLAPFPDYKMPHSILTKQGLEEEEFDSISLVYNAAKRDAQVPEVHVFSQERVWPTVIKNKLGLDLSNSFIVVASKNEKIDLFENNLAFHYSTEREEKYCKSLRFYKESGSISIEEKSLTSLDCKKDSRSNIQLKNSANNEYIYGKNFFDELVNIVTDNSWNINNVKKFLETYLLILKKDIPQLNLNESNLDIHQSIDGQFIDFIPQNIIRVSNGNYEIFDQEWNYHKDIPLGWLVFRALLPLFSLKIQFGESGSSFENSRIGFILAVFDELKCKVDDREISKYAQMEREFQSIVTGIPSNWDWESSKNIPVFRPNVYQTIEKLHHENNLLRQMVREQRAMLTKFDRNIMVRIWRKMKSMF